MWREVGAEKVLTGEKSKKIVKNTKGASKIAQKRKMKSGILKRRGNTGHIGVILLLSRKYWTYRVTALLSRKYWTYGNLEHQKFVKKIKLVLKNAQFEKNIENNCLFSRYTKPDERNMIGSMKTRTSPQNKSPSQIKSEGFPYFLVTSRGEDERR
jgi:hypothetical protein